MTSPNPFAAPVDATHAATATAANSPRLSVPAEVVAPLRETTPWVRLMGVLTVIGAAFLLLMTIVVLAAPPPNFPRWLALVYLVIAALYVPPAVHLLRYAKSIEKLVITNELQDLQAALTAQRSFWRFVGIVVASYLGLIALGLFIAVVIGATRG